MIVDLKDCDIEIYYVVKMYYNNEDGTTDFVYLYNITKDYILNSTMAETRYKTGKDRNQALRIVGADSKSFENKLQYIQPHITLQDFSTRKIMKVQLAKIVNVVAEDSHDRSYIDSEMPEDARLYIGRVIDEPTYIKDWKHLAEVDPKSMSHNLKVDVKGCCGNIDGKIEDEKWRYGYLSTHTFYDKTHEESTGMLRACGFNVTIANWDANTVEEPVDRPKAKVLIIGGNHRTQISNHIEAILKSEVEIMDSKVNRLSSSSTCAKGININHGFFADKMHTPGPTRRSFVDVSNPRRKKKK
jgi:hypothetical protein